MDEILYRVGGENVKTDHADCQIQCPVTVPIRGSIKGTDEFPIQKCAIFRKFKEIKELRGGGRFCTPHKRFRRLTPKLREGAIYGRKLTICNGQNMMVDKVCKPSMTRLMRSIIALVRK
jgi:hypothetical protein